MNRTTACPGRSIEGGPHVVVLVRVHQSGETMLCRIGEGVTLRCGDHLVVPTRHGRDLARVLGPVSEANRRRSGEVVAMHRVATPDDLEQYRAAQERADNALRICRERVDQHGLDMTLVGAHYVIDEPRLVFFFTAESRVDFRELVKDLSAEFRVRIELRQIGVRDEARMLGGLGVCGRVLCCNGISDRLKPVSIKMAKVQNLSLNSTKISGPCGRLLCCLEYEFEFYRDERRGLPSAGGRVRYQGELYRIVEVNILTRRVRLEGEDRIVEIEGSRFYQEPKTNRWAVREETGEAAPAVASDGDLAAETEPGEEAGGPPSDTGS